MQMESQIAKAASRGLHDVAQPLTVVQGILELTLEQARTVEDYRESVTSALAEVARVTACFEHVRQLVRLQQPAPDVCDFSITETVQRVVEEMRDSGIKVGFDSGIVGDDRVHTSPGRIRQALSLLLSAIALNWPDDLWVSIEAHPWTLTVRMEVSGSLAPLASALEMPTLIAASAGAELQINETSASLSLSVPGTLMDQPTDKKGTFAHV